MCAPLQAGCNASSCTSGLQVWVKDVSSAEAGPGLAVLLVNHGDAELVEYSVAVSKLPPYFKHGGKGLAVRDVWNRKDAGTVSAGGAIKFTNVGSL